jgi:tRNA nucleotidyltransferase (CCA-adding enzyme)
LEQRKHMTHAEIFNLLKGYNTETILYMMVCTTSKTAKKRISLYHTQLRNIAVTITGKDLLKTGLQPGPLYSRTMQAVLEAKLNGLIKTREDELEYVKNIFSALAGDGRRTKRAGS